MKPSIGRIVWFHGFHSNGIDEHPAIITRVWTDTCVNLTVFPDCGAPVVQTSVVEDEAGLQQTGWRWPIRVE